MEKYERIGKIGEGSFGVVYKGRDPDTKETVALKMVTLSNLDEGVPPSAIREISILKEMQHDNIIRLKDVVHTEKLIYLVLEYMEMDLQKLINTCPELERDPPRIKKFMYQILCGIAYCHSHRILHRDLKPSNILIDQPSNSLKLADFGLSRACDIQLRTYSHEVVSLPYKAPELLLRGTRYFAPVDMWSIGCIFAELKRRSPLFYANTLTEISQLHAIFRILGTPNDETWPGFTSMPDYQPIFPVCAPQDLAALVPNLEPAGMDLLSDVDASLIGVDGGQKLLCYDPSKRITAKDALAHEYFKDLELVPPP